MLLASGCGLTECPRANSSFQPGATLVVVPWDDVF